MSADRRDLRRRLFALAADQAGHLTAAQAKAVGYSYSAHAHHVGAGNWIRVDRCIFRLSDWLPGDHDELARLYLWSKERGGRVVSDAERSEARGTKRAVGRCSSTISRERARMPGGFRPLPTEGRSVGGSAARQQRCDDDVDKCLGMQTRERLL